MLTKMNPIRNALTYAAERRDASLAGSDSLSSKHDVSTFVSAPRAIFYCGFSGSLGLSGGAEVRQETREALLHDPLLIPR